MSRTLDAPIHQPFYQFTNENWEPVNPDATTTTKAKPLHILHLATWNIDYRAPCPDKRMTKALQYLSTLHNIFSNTTSNTTSNSSSTSPSIIFLQEMIPSDLDLIQQTPWIRIHFYITDILHEERQQGSSWRVCPNWRSRYGTTALIDKRVGVRRVFRVLYSTSKMGRDALFVDVSINGNANTNATTDIQSQDQMGEDGRHGIEEEEEEEEAGAETGKPETSILRLCNTHLESFTSNPPIRPVQLRLASHFMRGRGPKHTGFVESREDPELPIPHAAILAGDLNAFAPEDETAPEECGLRDAFLELGGQEGSEEGFTWGQQMAEYERGEFGCSRMDKVLFCGEVEVQSLEKIGSGEKFWIEYPEESDSEESSETGEDLWVTDHIGLQAVFRIVG
ncbi:endonuclease/exonuclease/phosphatase family protein [Aspergillus affinis]|uniref:endonuclease/exonuclease/phosphatase family protein n=1 Tax=Aspergillus affinis TaxID=1070780 RepID=UPI0022FDCD63|nr:uncharacterized protein KD926_002697 [Aspergillus affinis]KAI9043807.1 hypothetical protein KD926_002697 [Aspergillus affinis]